MNYNVTALTDGIIRISFKENSQMEKNYFEKYGILTIPKEKGVDNVRIDGNKISLPSGRILEFTKRGEFDEMDDEFWQSEIDYQNEKFKDKIPQSRIEGRPEEVLPPDYDLLRGDNYGKKFGISFKIDEDEKFYGLGEGGRDKVQLRGFSYQNWAIYQFDEVAIPLVYSNKNWGLFINAEGRNFVDIDDFKKGRLTVLGNFDNLDVFLLYGNCMKDILKRYAEMTGKCMLFPKWAYGLTYIAQIHQNQFEILDDMMKFRSRHIPCDCISLEPGWMNKFYDYSFEKDWNLEKFHMGSWMRRRGSKENFIGALNRFGFHIALWMCMAYDLCDEEERRAGGESKIRAWYDHVKPFAESGVDGFKIDPADMIMRMEPGKYYTNGKSEFEMHNISQVLVMKQMNQGFTEQLNQRPFIHYSGGYMGQQHWGGATTGDNGGMEGSMIWLQNLAMSGFMNSTVDMNIFDIKSIHFAMLAPWAHHNAWSGVRQPWYAGEEHERVYTYYARLRYSILPYLYSAAIECNETGVPMIRPMALQFQNDEKCSELKNQYMLGDSILISAFTNTVYLPEGKWLDFWTGKIVDGGFTIENYQPPKDRGGAFFIKMGAIIPKWSDRDYVGQFSEEEIILHIYPCGKSEYIFREDDGISLDYKDGKISHTKIICEEMEDEIYLNIGSRCGDYDGKCEKRIWKIKVESSKPVRVNCEEENAEVLIN